MPRAKSQVVSDKAPTRYGPKPVITSDPNDPDYKPVIRRFNRGSDAEERFAHAIAVDRMHYEAALIAAGIRPGANPRKKATALAAKPHVAARIAELRAETARANAMTKQKVMDGMLEAIEMAKVQADPLTMISGWREIGKMCGFYAPTRAEIAISVQAKEAQFALTKMSDSELLALSGEELNVLDAEFREVAREPAVVAACAETAGEARARTTPASALHEDDDA